MRTRLFEKHFAEEAVNSVNDTIKNQYDEIVDMAISKMNSVDMLVGDADRRLMTIKSEAITDLKRLSTNIRTNMPVYMCENAVLKALGEAVAIVKAGKIID